MPCSTKDPLFIPLANLNGTKMMAVNDKSIHVTGGLQRIQTLDGYIISLSIKESLTRLLIHSYIDHEWDNLPQVILKSELE
jgi:hypothetical protein